MLQKNNFVNSITYADAILSATKIMLKKNKNVFVLGQGVDDPKGHYGTTLNLHKDFGNNVICNISESSLIEEAKKEGKTRAEMSMRVAKEDMNGGIVVIGNAPTALLEVMKMITEGITKPDKNFPQIGDNDNGRFFKLRPRYEIIPLEKYLWSNCQPANCS